MYPVDPIVPSAGVVAAVTAWRPAVVGLPVTFLVLVAWMDGFWSVSSRRSASEAHRATREKIIEARVRRFLLRLPSLRGRC
jgi:hypothetical protein